MRESAAYQAWVEEGRVIGARGLLLKQGEYLFGAPPRRIRERIEQIDTMDGVFEIADRLFHVNSWEELLAGR